MGFARHTEIVAALTGAGFTHVPVENQPVRPGCFRVFLDQVNYTGETRQGRGVYTIRVWVCDSRLPHRETLVEETVEAIVDAVNCVAPVTAVRRVEDENPVDRVKGSADVVLVAYETIDVEVYSLP